MSNRVYCMAHFVVPCEVADPTMTTTVYELQPDQTGMMRSVPVQKPMMVWRPVVMHCTLPIHNDDVPHREGAFSDPEWTKPGVPVFTAQEEADAWMENRTRAAT